MKKSTFILGIVSIMTLCLTACGKPNMSFEDAVDSIGHSQLQEMMDSAEYSQRNFNISTKFNVPEDDVKGNISISADSKHNSKDSQWESDISLKFSATIDWEQGKMQWNATVRRLAKTIYFKLNSLEMSSSDNSTPDEDTLNKLTWQRYTLNLKSKEVKEMIDDYIYNNGDFPEDYNIKNLYSKTKINKFINDFKESLNNEWALVYSGIYSQFNWYNAYKFSIDKKKSLTALVNYFRWIMPDDMIDDAMEDIEDEDRDKIFEGFPFTSFEWYLIITWKHKVQVVIENIDIDDYSLDSKINATFGNDGYKFVEIEDGEDIVVFSAMLNDNHYDVSLIVEDEEFLTWTITPSISNWKINIDFDLVIKYEDSGDKIKIPFQWNWSWEKINEFNVKAPKNSKNLMDVIKKYNDYIYNTQNYNTNTTVIEYNDNIVNLTISCSESEDNIRAIYEDENADIEDIKTSINNTIKECKNDLQKVNNLWNWKWDSSLKDWATRFLEKEVEYYQKFYELLPYLYKQELTGNEKATYDSLSEQLGKIDEDLSKASDNLEALQTQFAKKYSFDLEDEIK